MKVFNIYYKSNIIIRYGFHSLSACMRPICVTRNPTALNNCFVDDDDNIEDEDDQNDDNDGNNDEHKRLLQSN